MGRAPERKCTPALSAAFVLLAIFTGACSSHRAVKVVDERPDVAPVSASPSVQGLRLDRSQIKPMYTEMIPIDLPSVVRAAGDDNLAVRQARQTVEASRGKYESAIGAAFPVIVPTALFEHVEGTVRATEGNLVGVGFNTFQPSIAIQWIVNPGRVIYDIIASKKRLAATEHRQRAVVLETLRRGVVQYYDLVRTQAWVEAAQQGVVEAEELLRINRLRVRTGTGVPADELRAVARLAQRRQDRVMSLKGFYDASVELAVTLHLDSSVTLVPKIDELPPVHLVRDDFGIEDLLGFAVRFRPDLEQVRVLLEAAAADKGSTLWGAFGPQTKVSYQYGGITGNANNVAPAEGIPGNLIVNPVSPTGSFGSNPITNGLIKEGILRSSRRLDGRDDRTFGFRDQQRVGVGIGWRLSFSAFGNLRTARALTEQARIEVDRRLDQVTAQVVTAAQASRANSQLVQLAQQQVDAAQEALRLTEANLQAGTMTTLDVLQAQDAATQARFSYAEAVVRYNQSQVDLLAAIGLIDEKALVAAIAEVM